MYSCKERKPETKDVLTLLSLDHFMYSSTLCNISRMMVLAQGPEDGNGLHKRTVKSQVGQQMTAILQLRSGRQEMDTMCFQEYTYY
jgi:hypothetical protein